MFIAANLQAGDLMVGNGGARKVRFARPGMGKRGGYRVIFYFAGEDVPLFLLNVFVKGNRANLSKADQNALRSILSKVAEAYRQGPTQ